MGYKNMNKIKKTERKKGFTLIEIIVCIVLIAIIGTTTTIGITNNINNNKYDKLKKITDNFKTALEVYLSSHEEIEENLMLYSKAAVVTLETLKNDGLIEDNLINPVTKEKFNYKNSYFTLLEGEVIEKTELPSNESTNCEYNQVGINIINSWDLTNIDEEIEILYICPKKDYSEDIKKLNDRVNELASELAALKDSTNDSYNNSKDVKEKLKIDSLFGDLTYTAKGLNPNNYVEFEVNSNSSAFSYFPNESDKNLWRIVSIDSDGKIKLFYPKAVKSNNYLNYTTESSTWCDYGTEDVTTCTFYKMNHATEGDGKYYRYNNNDGYVASEILEDVTVSGSKKEALYNAIVNKNWIVAEKYFPYYTVSSSGTDLKLDTSRSLNLKMGMINPNEINSSINISDSWLYNYSMMIGYLNKSVNFEDYYLYVYSNEGNIDFATRKRKANRCTNSSCSRDKDSSSHFNLYTYTYYPVVTLNTKVELIEQNCSEDMVKGSKECPYKLSCTNC